MKILLVSGFIMSSLFVDVGFAQNATNPATPAPPPTTKAPTLPPPTPPTSAPKLPPPPVLPLAPTAAPPPAPKPEEPQQPGPYLFRRWLRTPFQVSGMGLGLSRRVIQGTIDASKAIYDGSKDVVQIGADSLIAPVKVMLQGVVNGTHTWSDKTVDMYNTAKFALKQAREEYRKYRPTLLQRARRDADNMYPDKSDDDNHDVNAENDDKFIDAVSTLIMNPTKCQINLQVVSCDKLDEDDETGNASSASADDDEAKLLSLCMVEIDIVECADDIKAATSGLVPPHAAPPISKKSKRSIYSKYKLRTASSITPNPKNKFHPKRKVKRTVATAPLLLAPLTYLSKWLHENIGSRFVQQVFNNTKIALQKPLPTQPPQKSAKLFVTDPNPPIILPFFGNNNNNNKNKPKPAPPLVPEQPIPPQQSTIAPSEEPEATTQPSIVIDNNNPNVTAAAPPQEPARKRRAITINEEGRI